MGGRCGRQHKHAFLKWPAGPMGEARVLLQFVHLGRILYKKDFPRFEEEKITSSKCITFKLSSFLADFSGASLGKVHVIFRPGFPCPLIQAMNSQDQPNSGVGQIMAFFVGVILPLVFG